MIVMIQATAIRKLETCNIHFVQAARVDFLMGSTFHASQQYICKDDGQDMGFCCLLVL